MCNSLMSSQVVSSREAPSQSTRTWVRGPSDVVTQRHPRIARDLVEVKMESQPLREVPPAVVHGIALAQTHEKSSRTRISGWQLETIPRGLKVLLQSCIPERWLE
ncbi:hypothetical protein S245_025977 [Arachis hypogaea]|nr:uncharacterized protein DS421_8g230030 [Arachis hypogaea]